MRPGPLRFLVLAVGLWICARAAILAPGWWDGQDAPGPSTKTRTPSAAAPSAPTPAPVSIPMRAAASAAAAGGGSRDPPARQAVPAPIPAIAPGPGAALAWPDPIMAAPERGAARAAPIVAPPGPGRSPGRWSVSAWLLVRREPGGSALAPGGTLGGSQAGARIAYRLGDGLALSGRASLPLRRIAGAEAAAGLDWRPVASIPVAILAERRQALGREGRSAFALTLYGGGGLALPRRLRLDAYGQAGVVGMKARDLFADGAIRVSAPVGPFEVGVGARGAAQPGAARLDAGPGLSYRLPVRGANVRIEADWRWRVAGAAAPGSGLALTLTGDF